MPTQVVIDNTFAEIQSKTLAVISGTPVAGQTAVFTSAFEIEGVTGGNGALALITEVVTSGSQATVSFSSIPNIYRDLVIRVRGRGDTAAAFVAVTLAMNGDSGAHYNDEYEKAVGTAFSAAQNVGASIMSLGLLPGATAPANYPGILNLLLADYRGTTFYKAVTGTNALGIGTGADTQVSGTVYGLWRSTSAITAVVVGLGAGNFVDGSVVSLYGSL